MTKPKTPCRKAILTAVAKAHDALSDASSEYCKADIHHRNAISAVKGKELLVREARERLNAALDAEASANKELGKKRKTLDTASAKLDKANIQYKAAVSADLKSRGHS
jgi:hypothetical protein